MKAVQTSPKMHFSTEALSIFQPVHGKAIYFLDIANVAWILVHQEVTV